MPDHQLNDRLDAATHRTMDLEDQMAQARNCTAFASLMGTVGQILAIHHRQAMREVHRLKALQFTVQARELKRDILF